MKLKQPKYQLQFEAMFIRMLTDLKGKTGNLTENLNRE